LALLALASLLLPAAFPFTAFLAAVVLRVVFAIYLTILALAAGCYSPIPFTPATFLLEYLQHRAPWAVSAM
jgi:hypothetical protein